MSRDDMFCPALPEVHRLIDKLDDFYEDDEAVDAAYAEDDDY